MSIRNGNRNSSSESEKVLTVEEAREFLQERQPWQLVAVGRNLLRKGQPREAALALEEALQQTPDDHVCRSYLGLALALDKSYKGRKPIQLCEEAAKGDPYDANLLYNLIRVYLMGNHRKKANRMLQRARELDPDHRGLAQLADGMGRRRPPVFGFLPRRHPVNRHAGMLLTNLGLR